MESKSSKRPTHGEEEESRVTGNGWHKQAVTTDSPRERKQKVNVGMELRVKMPRSRQKWLPNPPNTQKLETQIVSECEKQTMVTT